MASDSQFSKNFINRTDSICAIILALKGIGFKNKNFVGFFPGKEGRKICPPTLSPVMWNRIIMQVLTENEIQESIIKCNPHKIAVAYIGIDWRSFVSDTSHLEAVIVSPTFGTNPRAIVQLAKAIGWDKLCFLNELHAKIYLGQNSAVVGSANLTYNGLSGQSLFELCVEIRSETGIRRIESILDDLKQRAQFQYPTTGKKKEQIKELEKIWGAAIANRIVPPMKSGEWQQFIDFDVLAKDHFYVLWYQPIVVKYSDDLKALESVILNDIHFAQSDNVEKNKWALVWRITDSLEPHKSEPGWLYIHDVFKDGIVDEGYEYPKCAIQRSDLEIPTPPFEITKEVENAFKKAVVEKDIAKYLIQDNKIFNLKYSLKGIPTLVKRMKQYMANKANVA